MFSQSCCSAWPAVAVVTKVDHWGPLCPRHTMHTALEGNTIADCLLAEAEQSRVKCIKGILFISPVYGTSMPAVI